SGNVGTGRRGAFQSAVQVRGVFGNFVDDVGRDVLLRDELQEDERGHPQLRRFVVGKGLERRKERVGGVAREVVHGAALTELGGRFEGDENGGVVVAADGDEHLGQVFGEGLVPFAGEERWQEGWGAAGNVIV